MLGTKRFILTLVVVLAGLTVAGLHVASRIEQSRLDLLVGREHAKLSAITRTVSSEIADVEAALHSAANDIYRSSLEVPQNNRDYFNQTLKALLSLHRDLVEAQFVSPAGIELARWARSVDGAPTLLSDDIVDASDESFFGQAVGYTGSDLIIERAVFDPAVDQFGSIPIATNRIALWVTESDGTRLGLLLVKFNFSEVIEQFRSTYSKPPLDELFVLSPTGQVLLGGERFRAFEFGADKAIANTSFAERMPELWDAIQTESTGVYKAQDGLYIFDALGNRAENRPLSTESELPRGIVFIPNESLYSGSALHQPEFIFLVVILYTAIISAAMFYWRSIAFKRRLLAAAENFEAASHVALLGTAIYDINAKRWFPDEMAGRLLDRPLNEFAEEQQDAPFERIAVEDHARARAYMDSAIDGKAGGSIDYKVLWRDASVHYIRSTATRGSGADGRDVLRVTLLDVTQQVQNERTLVEQKNELTDALATFKLAQSAARFGVSIGNPVTGLIEADEVARELYDLPSEEFPKLTFDVVAGRYVNDAREARLARLESGAQSKMPYEVVHKVRWRDGREHILQTLNKFTENEQGEMRFVTVALDMTERVEREDALTKAFNTLDSTCDRTNTGIAEVNVSDGTLTANDVWKRMFGYVGQDLIQWSDFFNRLPEYDRPRVQLYVDSLLEKGSAGSLDYDFVDDTGGKRRYRIIGNADQSGDGHLLLNAIVTDITDLYLQSRALSEQTLKQTNLFKIISHELRTPAAAIQMLTNELSLSVHERDEMQSVTTHLINVIDDLRTTVNPTADILIHSAPFSLERLLLETERQTSNLASSAGVALEIACPRRSDDLFLSDAYRLRSVLTNLIRNAVLHSEGSHVWLSADVCDEDAYSILTLRVEDDGRGIPADQVDRLFEPFERGESKAGGTGVGMHLVKSWIEKLGGSVTYSDRPDGGACFTIELKLRRATMEDKADLQESKRLEAKALLQGKRILLVEDDRILRRTTSRLLEKNFGAELLIAEDGVKALEILSAESVDLILTDYFMPNMDGRQLIEEVRLQGLTLPIFALTAATIGDEQEELSRAGADDVLSKPLDINLFSDAIVDLQSSGKIEFALAEGEQPILF